MAFGAALILTWKKSGRNIVYAIAGTAGMVFVGVDLSVVAASASDPVSATLHGTLLSYDRKGTDVLLWAKTSDLSIVFAGMVLVAFAVLVYRQVRDHHLLTAGAALCGLVASTSVLLNVVQYKLEVGVQAWEILSRVDSEVWGVLLVALMGYVLLAVVVGIVRGARRFKRRAQLQAVTGSGMTAEVINQ